MTARPSKEHIITEIQRTAAENDGVALGQERFHRETGISPGSWRGKYWLTWIGALEDSLVQRLTSDGELPAPRPSYGASAPMFKDARSSTNPCTKRM